MECKICGKLGPYISRTSTFQGQTPLINSHLLNRFIKGKVPEIFSDRNLEEYNLWFCRVNKYNFEKKMNAILSMSR